MGGKIQKEVVGVGPVGITHNVSRGKFSILSLLQVVLRQFQVVVAVSQAESWLISLSCPGENDLLYLHDSYMYSMV